MRKSFRYAALALMLVFALIAAACSKSLTLQEYFTKIGDIQKQYDDETSAIQQEAQSSTATDEASILADVKGFIDDTVAQTSKTNIELEALKPPNEAKDSNEEFVAAFGDLLTAMKAAQAAVSEATTVDAAISALGSDTLTTAGQALDKACNDLSAIATQNKVATTLHCAEPGKDAQASLRNSLAAAKTLFTDTDDYSGISVEAMAGVEPSLSYVEGAAGSTGSNEVSIYTDGSQIYAAAALSDSGTCYYVKDDAATGTTYGTGSKDACTGQAAADSASASSW